MLDSHPLPRNLSPVAFFRTVDDVPLDRSFSSISSAPPRDGRFLPSRRFLLLNGFSSRAGHDSARAGARFLPGGESVRRAYIPDGSFFSLVNIPVA